MKEGWICPKCGKVLAPWVHFEEYNATFNCNLNKDAFDAIMGNPINIKDADELIFVDPDTHEKMVFKRVKEEDEA